MSHLALLVRDAASAFGRLSRCRASEKCVTLCLDANSLHFSSSSSRHQNKTSSRCYTSSAKTKPVRIGCASGFWGDTATSVPQLVYGGKLDFLVFDYLSEITMSLLTAAKAKAPNLGYTPDFVQVALAPFINDIHRRGIRIVSNAGGVNPLACANAVQEVIGKAGLDLKVAVVTGDDLMPHRNSLSEVKMADSGGRGRLPETLHSMNAYLGAAPIRRCLDLGADIVVTGRCVDSALALGPLMHSFGWERDDYDLLAAGSLAGHLIECGAQSTGGIFTDWHRVPDWDNIGFPVVECSSDGSFVLSKPPKTGGLVSFGTVAEQLVYEIGDPRRYLLPDVTCDFSQVVIKKVPGVDGGAVRVTRAKGFAPSHDYKVCATYLDGFRATAVCPVGGPRAAEKARRTAESIIKRTKRIFKQLGLNDFSSVNIQVLGAEDTYGANARTKGCREAVIWMAVHHRQKEALELFSREIAPAGTGMAPGLMGIVGGRPRVSPVLKPFFFLHPKSQLQVDIHVGGELVESLAEVGPDTPEHVAPPTTAEEVPDADLPSGPHSYRLEELAYTRSGDKGDSANIGVIARHPLFFAYLKKHLTSSVVEDYFSHVIQPGVHNAVTRYTLPGIHGLNFVLQSSLGGGGVASLRSDPQGKAYGQMLLDLKLRGLPDLKSLVD
ncbi:uncharacterized protein LOC113139333 [Mastacembelus armatus]|uniref:Si:ch73-132f6.5 n=1 Tax=Mastacembelus armatus TaxID=205130 RepID=A0A3Q3LWT9_9TELE|nr:uncharacterized protein LOC113139333 [Mastacembelus armatus]XP_026178263.1 uncharacterized protein LOC113139333 [Mastacembelus armatus]